MVTLSLQVPRHEDVWDKVYIHGSGESHAKAALSPGRLRYWVVPRISLKGVEEKAHTAKRRMFCPRLMGLRARSLDTMLTELPWCAFH